MKKLLQLSIVIALACSFAGCEPGSVIVTARPEVPYYARPVQPGPGYIWIDGDWYWSGGRYLYRNGYWGRPRGHRTWVGGSWEQDSGGYHWRRGRWR